MKYKREAAQTREPYVDELPSKTDQSFRKEVDVNSIMAKYAKTGAITHLARNEGYYADVSAIPDLQGAFDQVALAAAAFKTLPAQLREDLRNDPTQLPGFLLNPANRDKAIEYGLIEKPQITPDVPSGVPPKAESPKS